MPVPGGVVMHHENRGELHGITVILTGASGKTYLGRFHEATPRGVVMKDLGVHDPGTSPHDLPTWLDRAKRFGVPVEHRMLVVPADEAGECVRFAEWELSSSA
ncbi:MAG: hypothetical protein KJZ47_06325 [Gemmatimonadales bacterium]|nr:hypothetical protein [Gemmatimonadales bacterium]